MTFFKLSTTSCDTVEADDGIVQPDLRLWPDRDPNLHRIGIYKFEVAADALKAALERVIEPNEHDNQRVEFELSDSSLHCAVKMKNGEFGAVAAVTLREQTKTGAAPVKFSIDALRIYKVSKFVLGRLAFEFNQDTAKLKVSQVGSIFSGTIDVIPAPFEPADVDERSLGKIHSSDLRDGFRYASILSLRKSPPAFSDAGVRIAEGTVSSGYYRAASCFASPTLPVGLDFTVPKQFVAAARWVFGKFHGDIEVVETALRIRLRSPELEVYWTKGGFWPKFSEFRKNATLATVEVDLMNLSAFLHISCIFLLENLRFEIGEGAKGRILKIFGESSKNGAKTFYPVDASSNDAGGPLATWKVMICAKDAYHATVAVTTERVLIRVFDRGIAIESVGSENECKTLLAGVELR